MDFLKTLIGTFFLLLCILLLVYIALVCCSCICNSFMEKLSKSSRTNAVVHTKDNEYTLMPFGESGDSDEPCLIADSQDHVGINVESLQGSYVVKPFQQRDTISTVNLIESKEYGSSSVTETQVSPESMEKPSFQEPFPKLEVMMQEEITDDVIYDEADDEHTSTEEGKMPTRPGIISFNNMLFSQKQALRKVNFEIRNAISSADDSTCSDQGQQMNTDDCEERPYDLPDGITVYKIPPETDPSSPGAPHYSNRGYFQRFLACSISSSPQKQVSTESMEIPSSQDHYLKPKDIMQDGMTDDHIYDEANDEHTSTEEGKMQTRPGIIPFNANMLFSQKQALRKVSSEIRNAISYADDSTCSAQKQQQYFDSCEERPYDLPDGITFCKIPSDTDHSSTGVPHISNQRREYAQQFLTCNEHTPVKEEYSSIPAASTVDFDCSYSMPRELASQGIINAYENTLDHNDSEGKAQELVINLEVSTKIQSYNSGTLQDLSVPLSKTTWPESSIEQEPIYDEIPDSNNQIRGDSAECHLRDDAGMQMHSDKPLSDETAPIQLFQNMLLSQKKALRRVSLETREPITVSHESGGSNQKLINSSNNCGIPCSLLDERLPTVSDKTSSETPHSVKDMQGNVHDLLNCGMRTSFGQNTYLTAVASEEKMGNSNTMLEDLPEEATAVSYYENILLSKKMALK